MTTKNTDEIMEQVFKQDSHQEQSRKRKKTDNSHEEESRKKKRESVVINIEELVKKGSKVIVTKDKKCTRKSFKVVTLPSGESLSIQKILVSMYIVNKIESV